MEKKFLFKCIGWFLKNYILKYLIYNPDFVPPLWKFHECNRWWDETGITYAYNSFVNSFVNTENEPLQIHKKTSQWLQYIFYWKYLTKRERTKCYKQGWGHKVDVWWFMTWPCGWSHMADVWLFHDMTLWLRSQGRCVIFFWHYPVDEVTRLPYGWSHVGFWLFNTTFNDMTVISTILCQFYIWNCTKTINICGYGL